MQDRLHGLGEEDRRLAVVLEEPALLHRAAAEYLRIPIAWRATLATSSALPS